MGNILSPADEGYLGRDSLAALPPLASVEQCDDGDDSDENVDHRILVLGAGNFGTCIADHLADLGLDTTIWARDKSVVDSINTSHRNSKYLTTTDLNVNLKATSILDETTLAVATVVIFSIPTQHMRTVLATVKSHITAQHLIIFLNKGIETDSLLLPSEIVTEVLGNEIGRKATFLSGPSFAMEVVKRQPTCVVVASLARSRAKRTQRLFHAPHFRVYDSKDAMGVEVAGAYKNIIAIVSGACTGLGFQNNARAAIITRGLAEMIRLGVKLGADPLTFAGLAGVGDLMLTAQSEKSRNFTVGYRLGKGEDLKTVLESLGSVAEGVETARAAFALCRKLDVDSPICDLLYAVLFKGMKVEIAVKELMSREPSTEFRHVK